MEGFEQFVAARGDALLRTAFLLTGDRHLAEDAVQEALSRVLGRWARLVRSGHPEAYVRRALYSVVVDRSRRRSSRERPVADPRGPDRASDSVADGVASQVTVADSLSRLTPRQRQVLVLRFYEDLGEARTAEVMRCSPGTVKGQTAHALARLRVLAPELAATSGRAGSADQEVRVAGHLPLSL